MASFEAAMPVIYAHEVGPNNQFYSSHELDAGGPTAYGITLATYSAWLKRTATVEDMKAMSWDTAKQIYRFVYWGVIQGDSIKSDALATNFMDMAVLRGVVAATKTLQGCVGTVADGHMGPKTLKAIEAQNAGVLIVDYFIASQKALANLVVMKPSQIVFLNTWMRRVSDMLVPVSAALRQPAVAAKPQAA